MAGGYGLSPEEKDRDPLSASRYPAKNESPDKERHRLQIVLAEDNTGDVFMVREALTHHSIEAELICHRDGEQMLRYLQLIEEGSAPCPDLVLLDLNLPRYNGETILTRMRAGKVCADVPVVVITSSAAGKDRETAFRLGADEYFHKPIDYDDFMALGAVVLKAANRVGPPEIPES